MNTATGSPEGSTAEVGLDVASLRLMLEALEDYVTASLTPQRQLDLDHEDLCPEDIVRGMCGDDLGVQLAFIPEAFGGMGGGALDSLRICELMSRLDPGLGTAVFASFLGSHPIMVGGTLEQKQEWIGRMASEGILFAYGATEPDAGSSLGALTTTATPVEKDGQIVGYRLNGKKQWISNGSIADAYTVLAATAAGPTWFIVEKGAEGFSSATPEEKHGIRLSNTAALFLDDVYVPVERLVGGVEGQGMDQAQEVFGYTRLMVAAFGLGGGSDALERAITFSKNRMQGSVPLARKQGYTHKFIVPHAVALEAARALSEEVATRFDAGDDLGDLYTASAVAKYMATEAGNAAADAAIQAHGGYGYTRPYLVEKIKRDLRVTTIYEGTSEVMQMTIVGSRWQQHLRTKGEYYRQVARDLDALHIRYPEVGAGAAALGAQCLAVMMDAFRVAKLTRNQHLMFQLGDLIANLETAASFSRKAAAAADGRLSPKVETRFDAKGLAAMSRVFARSAALMCAQGAQRWLVGGVPVSDDATGSGSPIDGLLEQLPVTAVRAAQAGLLGDLDTIADIIYDR